MTDADKGPEPKGQHYVPRSLLRPWAIEIKPGQFKLRGYYWDRHGDRLRYKERGVAGFCFQIGLLNFRDYAARRAALETQYFRVIDDKGAKARDAMITSGPDSLSGEQRSDFVRLLLSLEARRPTNVARLRTEGAETLSKGLDDDVEIQEAFRAQGVAERPSEFAAKQLGWSFEDRALLIIQGLVDNPRVGGRLINAHWHLRRLRPEHGSLVLGDRPLIRIHGYEHVAATWVLPLASDLAFITANHPNNVNLLARLSGPKFVRQTNISSALQAERFVFSVQRSHERMFSKYLKPKA